MSLAQLIKMQSELQLINDYLDYCHEYNFKPSTYDELVARKAVIIQAFTNN
jgi:hypothetical protein